MRIILLFLTIIALTFSGCKEGTITYDIEFPKADSCEAAGNCDSGGGGGGVPPGGPVTNTNSNGSGAGFTVSKTIANVYENGSDNDTFTIVLVKAPTADVFMNITNPDTTEVDVSPTSISFGSGNWSTAQTINLFGVEDGISDGNLATNLTVSIDNSSDTDYDTGISNATVEVNSIDSSAVSAITLGDTGGSTSITESGATDNITVALSRQPAQNVTLTFTPSDATEFTVSPSSVTFGPGNFSVAQNIVLTAIEDNIVDGLQNVNLSSNSTSTDISYNNISATIAVAVVDSGKAPPAAISNLAASAGTQLNTLTWSKPTGATSYTIYWSTSSPVSTSSGNFTISDGDTVTYTHAGLTAGTRYYYAIVANNSDGASGLSNEVFGDPSAFSGCNTSGNLIDNDSSLILHYGFNNSLEDIKDVPGNSRYDLSNISGTIKYAQSCAYGQSAYFDSSTGYLDNTNFDDTDHSNLFSSGNFTMAMWFLADADMTEYSSLMSSKNISSGTSNDGGNWSFQFDDDGSNKIRWRSAQGGKVVDPYITHTVASTAYSKNQWYYATFVKHDNGTGQIYIDGALEATSTGTQHSPLQRLKLGINRNNGTTGQWKGYIDEFKVYNRAFDSDDVKNACLLYSQCTGITPAAPDNLTATAAGQTQINVAWNAVNGATNYTIQYGTSSGSYTSSATVSSGTTYSHTGLSAGTTYYYRIRANNATGSSSWSSEASATTSSARTVTLTPSGTTSITEGTTGTTRSRSFVATISASSTEATTVTLTLTGTATGGGVDYTLLSSTITINAGSTTGSATLNSLGDDIDENNETIIANITGVSGGEGAVENGTQTVTFTVTDDDTSGFTVVESSGSTAVAETGSTDTFTVVLDSKPSGNVVFALTDNDTDNSEISYTPTTLTFTTSNWNSAQTVTVTGVNDSMDDGDISSGITLAINTGSTADSIYDTVSSQTVAVTNTDDDEAKLKWSVVSNDVSVDEAGSEITSTTLLLDSQPNGNVVVDASIIDTSELTLIGLSSYTFTTSNWFNGQTIAVRGANDNIDDGDVVSQLRITVNTSSTADTTGYASLAAKNKNITTRDDDTAAFTVTQSSGSTSVTEAGSTDTFTVVLNTQPTGDVVFALTDNDTDNTEISYSPTTLTFTSGNWNSAQTVTVTGVDDSIDDDNVTSVITVAVNTGSTADSVYDGLSSQTVNTITVDDDVTRTVTMSRSPTSVTEGDSGMQTVTITATISATSTQATTVNFTSTSVPADAAMSSGIANFTRDWAWTSSSATISAGSLSGTATLVIYGDEVDEDTENVYINMSGVSGGQGAVEDGTQSTTVTINDDDNAGMTFRFVGDNATVSETGTISSDIQNTDNLTMKLATRPTGDVVIDLTSSDTGEFTISPSQMTFTSSNWSTDQIMTVTGQADGIEDGTVQVFARANINTAGTADAKYDALSQDSKAVYVYNVTTLTAPTITAVNAAEQQNQVVWNAYSGATGYKLYYDTNSSVSTSDPYFTIGSSMNAYYHNGLQSGQRVYYRVVATTGSGDSPMSNELSGLPTSFPGCTSSYVVDNDPNLIVHYPFEGNLEDVRDVNTDNRYDMTHRDNGGQTLKYAGSCAGGQSLYFDSTTGQTVNTQFTDTNVGGQLENDNFTISFWVVKDGDMVKFSSAVNSGLKATHSPTGDWSNKFQFDVGTSGNLRWVSSAGTMGSSGGMNQNQWYHVAGTFLGTQARLYIDGVQRAANAISSPQNMGFKALMTGVNRSADTASRHWKGYLDELKVYHGAKTQGEVAQDCMDESPTCAYVPQTAPTLTATGKAQSILLTWEQPGGTDNATIYWRTSGGSFEGSPSAPTASNNVINAADNQTSYLLTGLTGGHYYHFVIKANNKNGSSSVSSVVGNVQPTSFIRRNIETYNSGICKLQTDQSVKCRGRNNYSQFVGGSTAAVTSPTTIFGYNNVATFTYDYNKVTVLNNDHSFDTTGSVAGYGDETDSPLTNVTNPIQALQGNDFAAYLLSNGTIRTRGKNTYGQLGDGSNTDVSSGTTTVQVSGITTATKIAVAQWTGAALLSNGTVYTWGGNDQGQLGRGNKVASNVPVQFTLPSNTAVDIFASGKVVCALLANGQVWCAGDNAGSRITCDSSQTDKTTPVQFTTMTNLKEVNFGTFHSVLLTTDKTMYTCGRSYASTSVSGNATFQASISGSWAYTNGPILMDDIGQQGRIIEIDATGSNSYALMDNGTLVCVGSNAESQCSNTTSHTGNQVTPLMMEGM